MSGHSRMLWVLAAALAATTLPAVSGAADAMHVIALQAPAVALVGAPFDVGIELTGVATPTTLQVLRADTGAPLATVPVAAGVEHATARVQLADAGPIQLRVGDASATVESIDFLVDPTSIIQSSLVGYGAQFNHSLFYPRLNPLVPSDGATLKEKVNALAPRLVRVFFPAQALTDWVRLASFQQVVRMAQASGSTILVAWSGGYGNIDSNMSRFANALAHLVDSGVTNLRWVSLLNEPNGSWNPAVPKETWEHMYRALDADLRQAGVRDQVRLMGAGLVQNGQKAWLDYMVDHMSDILDAYSVHIYWDYWDTGKLESRLAEVRAIDLRTGAKPIYVTEFGVRGDRDAFGVPAAEPGLWADGETPMAQTNVTAFQLAWFDILASRLGYAGTITWDAFNAKYDSGTQDFSCIGPAPDFGLRPCYHLLRLFTATTQPGWRVVGVPGASGGKLVTAYTGPMGAVTVIGLDRNGGRLNDASGPPVAYVIGGLPPSTTFRVVLWNADGSGSLSQGPTVPTDANGVATLTVPQHAVFALTTAA
jgi:cellulase (glycosyl hydrolase family 5)